MQSLLIVGIVIVSVLPVGLACWIVERRTRREDWLSEGGMYR